MERRYGLIGNPVGHSYSQRYFEQKWHVGGVVGSTYGLYCLPTLEGLPALLQSEGLCGFNVTMPFKRSIVPLLTALTPEAAEVGAVNCVAVSPEGLIGHNTDCQAFADTLRPNLEPWHTSALVLGTGGAAAAVTLALRRMGIAVLRVSRTPANDDIGYAEAARLLPSHLLLVNATPVGMGVLAGRSPWARADLLTPRHLVYDLIYNPAPTGLMQQAAAQGAAAVGGLPMLHRQADLSEAFWNAHPAQP